MPCKKEPACSTIRGSTAEQRVASTNDSQRSAAETRAKLAETTKRLQEYESIFGDALRKLPPDVQSLTKQLRAKEDEIERLQLQEQQREQVCYVTLCQSMSVCIHQVMDPRPKCHFIQSLRSFQLRGKL